jgi:hypothetical protein
MKKSRKIWISHNWIDLEFWMRVQIYLFNPIRILLLISDRSSRYVLSVYQALWMDTIPQFVSFRTQAMCICHGEIHEP